MYKVLPRRRILDWAGRAVEFELGVIKMSDLMLVDCPDLLFETVNSVNIESAIHGEQSLKII